MNNLFLLASYLTDPICKAREKYWLGKAVGKTFYAQIFFWIIVGIVLLPLGILVRYCAKIFQKHPYLFLQGEVQYRVAQNTFSLFLWNVCCVPAGYSITDGGVLPWQTRIEAIIQKICDQGADIVCLTEVFDMHAAQNIVDRLKKHYAYLYYNIGPKAIGVPSGFLVASKVHIKDTEFIRFPAEHLVGRTKHAAKGVFGFTLATHQKEVVIFLTHLQHSEECEFPTTEEIIARESQMNLIMNQIENSEYRRVIVTGDLNMDEVELENTSWFHRFDRGIFPGGKTWGGDEFCAHLVNKKVSGPRTYDYTLMLRGGNMEIDSSYVETEYDPSVFSKNALSDHKGIMTAIKTRD